METHPILAPSSYAQKFTRFIFEKEEKKKLSLWRAFRKSLRKRIAEEVSRKNVRLL